MFCGVVCCAAIALWGCVPGGDDAADDATLAQPEITVTVPPERQTPFCAAMSELSQRLADAGDEDVTEIIIDAYSAMVDEVPAEIEADFLAVLAELQAGTDTTSGEATTTDPTVATLAPGTGTTAPFWEEGYLPDDDPALRLNEYVLFSCRDSQNNPGPPATEPSLPPVETT